MKRGSSYVCVLHSQVPRKQVVEKPIRAVEREILAMEKKNRTYTLLEDSDGELDVPVQKEKETGRKKRSKDKGSKRKHIRQKQSESSSEDDAPHKFVYLYKYINTFIKYIEYKNQVAELDQLFGNFNCKN